MYSDARRALELVALLLRSDLFGPKGYLFFPKASRALCSKLTTGDTLSKSKARAIQWIELGDCATTSGNELAALDWGSVVIG